MKGCLIFAGGIRGASLEAAAFVIYQSVRATMLGYLLEAPAAVDDDVIIAELTELIFRYPQSET